MSSFVKIGFQWRVGGWGAVVHGLSQMAIFSGLLSYRRLVSGEGAFASLLG